MNMHGTPGGKGKDRPEGEEAHREQREYPHGSGDRNTVSPDAPDDVDRDFHGGTQRTTEPDGEPGRAPKK
jgi:hypothetical protein